MKLSQEAYITIMAMLQMEIDYAKSQATRQKKAKKLEAIKQEIEAIGTY